MNDFPLEIAALNQELRAWELTYNTIRPHQALDGRTPKEYPEESRSGLVLSTLSHMYWTSTES